MRLDALEVLPVRRVVQIAAVLAVLVLTLVGTLAIQARHARDIQDQLAEAIADRNEAIAWAEFDLSRSLAMVETERDRQLADLEHQWEQETSTIEERFAAAMAAIRMNTGLGDDPRLSAEQRSMRDNLVGGMRQHQQRQEIARMARDARRLAARSVSDGQIEAIVRSVVNWTQHYYGDIASYRVPLVLAMIGVESNFRMDAVSSMDARCAMQVLPVHVREINFLSHVSDLNDIDKCVRAGVHILHRYETQSDGDLVAALMRYGGVSPDNRSAHHFYVQRIRDSQARMSMRWHIPEEQLLAPAVQVSELNRELTALRSEVETLRRRRAELENSVSLAMQMCTADYQASR
jgi:hypothetical protein